MALTRVGLAAGDIRAARLRPRLLVVAVACLVGAGLAGTMVGPVGLPPIAVIRELIDFLG